MDEAFKRQLSYLGLTVLACSWDTIQKEVVREKPSYQSFLQSIVEREYLAKTEKARLARIKRARIPEVFVMETFPFSRQPRLDRKLVRELHDSAGFMQDRQDLVFIGPTGCGKTGLATAFLVQVISKGNRGLFIDFSDLINRLYQSRGDHSEENLVRKLAAIDVLLIDELGYISCEREQASLFFDLMRRRLKKTTTIITTQLGFEEWGNFLHDPHITAALLDRITINCTVFNMKDCISIRPKNILYAVSKDKQEKK
jgi:DNA replication protein DnaC